ncbi:S41 family peptidase [Streptodolium elevatio]|uniref:S41 family peptidase n=1 Tax=Streptodolium elevatio TaxID=3157996 RepID=A0ABV3DQN5_9ACTN
MADGRRPRLDGRGHRAPAGHRRDVHRHADRRPLPADPEGHPVPAGGRRHRLRRAPRLRPGPGGQGARGHRGHAYDNRTARRRPGFAGNGGSSPDEVAKLLGALAHGKTTGYLCDVKDRCTPKRTDDSVALLGLPFAALTDGRCASACDAFSAAVKDLRLGTLIGTRTSGTVSGPGEMYALDNGTLVMLPKYHGLAPNKEIVNTIGVAPDHFVPMTAADLSAGRDPGLDKAVSLL